MLALISSLTDAEDGSEANFHCGGNLLCNEGVAFAMVLAALAMTAQDVTASKFLQQGNAHVSGKCAARLGASALRTDNQFTGSNAILQINECRKNNNLWIAIRKVWSTALQRSFWRSMHLPVSRD